MNDNNRFIFTLEIYDNKTKKDIIVSGFNTNSLEVIIEKLHQANKVLEDQVKKYQ